LFDSAVIEAYDGRFKIEVSFRTLTQVMQGFCYRFWLKSMAKATKCSQNLKLENYPETFQQKVAAKVEAFVREASLEEKRFIHLDALALGLQVLALEIPKTFGRTLPSGFALYPSMATTLSGDK